VSRYPALRRDIAVIVDRALPWRRCWQMFARWQGQLPDDLTLFDVYQGKGIDPARKSVALGLTFQDPSRTLDDEEVNEDVSASR
jgi:phenylalanyl-tRNA synthetase beta chain